MRAFKMLSSLHLTGMPPGNSLKLGPAQGKDEHVANDSRGGLIAPLCLSASVRNPEFQNSMFTKSARYVLCISFLISVQKYSVRIFKDCGL